jgi:hypothetical protein
LKIDDAKQERIDNIEWRSEQTRRKNQQEERERARGKLGGRVESR